MKDRIRELASHIQEPVVAHRRHLHAHPEPSFHEEETAAYIRGVLDSIGVPHSSIAGCNCVIARIKGDVPGKTVAFRADIDALNMEEKNGLPYRSQNDGVMHACGHDGHVAVLLGLAELFAANRELLRGEVVFVFQHAEEVLPGGAVDIIKSGALKGVDAIFGLHVWSPLPVGVVGYSTGAMMASTDKFVLDLYGKGGHGSEPHVTREPLLAGAALVTQLQSLVARDVDTRIPTVVSVCRFQSGSAFNVIPDHARLEGTVRTCDAGVRDQVEQRIGEIAQGTCGAYGVRCEYVYERGYPALVNDRALVEESVAAISALTGLTPMEHMAVMGGEDFSYYCQEIPGAYFFVGCRNEQEGIDAPHHNPRFNLDERALEKGIQVFLAAYARYTGQA